MRPWYRKKRIMIPLVLAVIIGIAAVSSGGDDGDDMASNGGDDSEESQDENPNSSEDDIFPDRPDEKDGDKEREIGGAADLSGYTVTVTAAARQQQFNAFENEGYLVAEATLLNRDNSAQSYNTFDWKLITPSGTIIDPCFCGTEQLGSGDLAAGGTVSGSLIWEIGDAAGDYYIIFDPEDIGDGNRGVWKVSI
jgi:hypothetical protein